MTYSYEFTQKAEEDLEVILDYLTKISKLPKSFLMHSMSV